MVPATNSSCNELVVAGELPFATDNSFSMVVIPDTQQYRGRGTREAAEPGAGALTNRGFDGWADWVADNWEQRNIAFVSHMVGKNNCKQWALARTCMDTMYGRVSCGISVGNHDMTTGKGDSFPSSRSLSQISIR